MHIKSEGKDLAAIIHLHIHSISAQPMVNGAPTAAVCCRPFRNFQKWFGKRDMMKQNPH
jgi:hypothetical protein